MGSFFAGFQKLERALNVKGSFRGFSRRENSSGEISESVKCHFSKCRLSALNLKFDFISDGGCTREKQIQKALGSLPPCRNRCRFSESAICSSRVHPPSEIKSNFKFRTLRWRPLRWRLTLSENLGRHSGKCFLNHGMLWMPRFWTPENSNLLWTFGWHCPEHCHNLLWGAFCEKRLSQPPWA